MNYQIEIQRNNISLSQFIAAIKQECKKKGINCNVETKEFKNPHYSINNRYIIKNSKKIVYSDGYRMEFEVEENHPLKSEILMSEPLAMQTYLLSNNGSCYNEICEFTYDDDTKGHGYYFQLNKD